MMCQCYEKYKKQKRENTVHFTIILISSLTFSVGVSEVNGKQTLRAALRISTKGHPGFLKSCIFRLINFSYRELRGGKYSLPQFVRIPKA